MYSLRGGRQIRPAKMSVISAVCTRGDLGRLCPRAHGVARHASSVDMSRNDADFGCPGLRAPREVSKLGHLPAREPGAGARGA